MHKYLEMVQNDITKFENLIKDNEKRIKVSNELLKKETEESKKLSKRLEIVESEKLKLENQHSKKIKQRQDLLFNGENPKDLTSEISNIKEDLSLKNDEIIAVKERVALFNQNIESIAKIIDELNSKNQDLINKIKGFKYCIEYNTAAKAFLDVLQEIKVIPYIITHPKVKMLSEIPIPFIYAKGQTLDFFSDYVTGYNGGCIDKPIIDRNHPINLSLFYSQIEEPKIFKEVVKQKEEYQGVKYTVRNGSHVRTNIRNDSLVHYEYERPTK